MEKLKILIVDDDPDLTEVLKVILTKANYTVLTASNKKVGMEQVKAEKPSLIVLDVMMSTWQDGFEMSRELKNDPEFKHIPILILTSITEKTGVEFESSAGDQTWLPVDGFLSKPVEPEILLSEIEKLLQGN
jgi:CheY-like chemotaxis protein